MKEVFRKETVRVPSGKQFSVSGDGMVAYLTVDSSGNPVKASYNSCGGGGGGYCQTPEYSDFDECVRDVMYTILEHDTNEFRLMRDSLNSKYRAMAEGLRKSKASKYDF